MLVTFVLSPERCPYIGDQWSSMDTKDLFQFLLLSLSYGSASRFPSCRCPPLECMFVSGYCRRRVDSSGRADPSKSLALLREGKASRQIHGLATADPSPGIAYTCRSRAETLAAMMSPLPTPPICQARIRGSVVSDCRAPSCKMYSGRGVTNDRRFAKALAPKALDELFGWMPLPLRLGQ